MKAKQAKRIQGYCSKGVCDDCKHVRCDVDTDSGYHVLVCNLGNFTVGAEATCLFFKELASE
jgi:hypothetical protein